MSWEKSINHVFDPRLSGDVSEYFGVIIERPLSLSVRIASQEKGGYEMTFELDKYPAASDNPCNSLENMHGYVEGEVVRLNAMQVAS